MLTGEEMAKGMGMEVGVGVVIEMEAVQGRIQGSRGPPSPFEVVLS